MAKIAKPATVTPPLQNPDMPNQYCHILLVEDSLTDAILFKETFKDLAINPVVSHVTDGVKALELLRQTSATSGLNDAHNRPDLILLDLNLPRMDGRELLTILKSDPELRTIPVIVLSTSSAERDVQYCYEHYVNCYLKKPVDLSSFTELARAIDLFWLERVVLPAKT